MERSTGFSEQEEEMIRAEKKCFLCGITQGLELHHICFGADRKVSDKLGLTVWLCAEHHRGDYSPHHNKEFDLELKRLAQAEFLKTHSMAEWMDVKAGIGKNYLT